VLFQLDAFSHCSAWRLLLLSHVNEQGNGKKLELKKYSLGDVEKWAMSEVMQDSESSGKGLWSWQAVQSSRVQRKECTAEEQQGAGHPLQAPKAVSSHREETAADPMQAPFWQTDVSTTCLATTEHPGFGRQMSEEK